jgi:hypothetical protein
MKTKNALKNALKNDNENDNENDFEMRFPSIVSFLFTHWFLLYHLRNVLKQSTQKYIYILERIN